MSRRNWWTVALVVVAVLAGCLCFAPGSDAAAAKLDAPKPKQFDWTFSGTCCITSREFTTSVRAPIRVTSVLEPCGTRFGRTGYAVSLWRNGRFVGAKNVTCWGSATWKAQPPGAYRFRLAILPPWRDSQVFTGYGTVYYDGAAR